MFTLVEDYKYFRKLCQIATIITQQAVCSLCTGCSLHNCSLCSIYALCKLRLGEVAARIVYASSQCVHITFHLISYNL